MKKITTILLVVIFIFSCSISAFAGNEPSVPEDAIVLTSDMTTWGSEDGAWYVLDGDVSIGSRVVVSGTANLFLKDRCTLKIGKGINVPPNATLNIYGGNGELLISGAEQCCAGIGGNRYQACGNITINGGVIECRSGSNAAGIGTGEGRAIETANSGVITINGGKVVAIGFGSGCGIGGGDRYNSGTIIINGGTVNAQCLGDDDTYGAGIGAGHQANVNSITINGGQISAYGGMKGAGIGGSQLGRCDNICINGGDIYAVGGASGAASIGGGHDGYGGSITITGGNILAESFGGGGTVVGNGVGNRGDVTVVISGGVIDIISHCNGGRALSNKTTISPTENYKITVTDKYGEAVVSPIVEETAFNNSLKELHICSVGDNTTLGKTTTDKQTTNDTQPTNADKPTSNKQDIGVSSKSSEATTSANNSKTVFESPTQITAEVDNGTNTDTNIVAPKSVPTNEDSEAGERNDVLIFSIFGVCLVLAGAGAIADTIIERRYKK